MKSSVAEKLNTFLAKAIKADGALKGNIQLYDKKNETLSIIAQQGFGPEFLKHFKVVKAFDSSACGRAAGIGSPVVISDVELDIGFKPHLKVARAEGFRSVKSIPLISLNNKCVGVLSTHFKETTWSWEIKKLNRLSRELAEFISHSDLKTIQ
jgi:signal transduction protein with GAF and PtsI domain